MAQHKFVFVVCGAKEHIDTLHFSLRYLKHFSKNEIIVVTDTVRNEVPVIHDNVIDIKTPEEFTNHQSSIYLKTGLHKFLPGGNLYCYLDTDVVALNSTCDDVFNYRQGPVTFAADHCRMLKFSASAVKCDCFERNKKDIAELEGLMDKYDPSRKWKDPVMEEKKRNLINKFGVLKQNKLKYFFISTRFNAAKKKFKLDDDTFFDKQKKVWHDAEGRVIITPEENMVEDIEKNSTWRWNKEKERWIGDDGRDVYDLKCPHLKEYIFNRFKVDVKEDDFQHWNGGVFLFDDNSKQFMDTWFDKTMKIFTYPEWKTRDQGTLIATVWELGLQNQPLLPQKFNFIADWNNPDMMMDEAGNFTTDSFKTKLQPALIHVYHNFGRRGWNVWDYIETVLPVVNTN